MANLKNKIVSEVDQTLDLLNIVAIADKAAAEATK
jgi:hypothetical protein